MVLIITAMLVAIPIFQSQATRLRRIRSDSKADATRIVLDLDGVARYRTQYTMEPGISICLFETSLGAIRNTTSVDDELVETVITKEVTTDEQVQTVVDIALKRRVTASVFALSNRLVIDLAPDLAMLAAQPLDPPAEEPGEDVAALAPSPKVDAEVLSLSPREDVSKADDSRTAFAALPQWHVLAQFGFNAFLMIALVVIGIKLWRVARVSKRNSSASNGQDFVDMIAKLQPGVEKKSISAAAEHTVSVKSNTPVKMEKRKKKKEQVAYPVARQKRYEKVHKLAQLGMDRLAISQESSIPIGEVNLILDLSKARLQSKAN